MDAGVGASGCNWGSYGLWIPCEVAAKVGRPFSREDNDVRWIHAAPVLLLLSPWAMAQEEGGGLGLDLTEEAQPAPQEETPPPADTTSSTTAAEGGATATTAPTATDIMLGERDITQDDRVKSVQRKLYLKTHRFELTPMVTTSINDPFYLKWGGTLRAAWYPADTIAIVARGSLLQTIRTPEVRLAQSVLTATIYASQPRWMAMGDLEWSPIYGKVAIFNSILHFDLYLLGGLGVVNTATSELPGRLAADVGGGLRFVAKDWLAITTSVINTAYVDAPGGTTKGATQNMLTVNLGVSVFLPFESTGKEAE